ncbi:3-hydroxyacyl-CoA dehydrogenase family protein [Pararhodobacter marinus]|uniref:3-hydroxyacyl-CoA dehydrogenase family protein n=1 Tax=Pararhodobacter marinus TaxID=2184063 RepID=UPI0035186FAE
MTPSEHLAAIRARLSQGEAMALTRAAVAGGSPQALGLAVAMVTAGAEVALIEADDWDLTRARDALIRAGRLDGITLTTDSAAAEGAEVIVEASEGDIGLRLALLSEMARTAPDALRVSLGPGVSLGALKDGLRGPVALIDTDAPPPAIDLIEIAKGSDPRAAGFARALGALPVIVPLFLGAKLIAALEDEAEALVFQGSTPWEVDAAAEAYGFALGPCAAQDLRGLDRARARHRVTGHDLPVLDRMVQEGRLGRKAGVGWYRYPGGGGRVIDPLIEDLAREEAHFAGFSPREIPESEIRRRLIGALIRAGHALRVEPAMVDLVSVLACGFPAAKGGVLFDAAPR